MNFKATILLIFLSSTTILGQSFFKPISETSIKNEFRNDRNIIPDSYQSVALDFQKLNEYLRTRVPSEGEYKSRGRGINIDIPDPSGKTLTYQIFETKMMEENLAKKYPEIRTYKGVNIHNKAEHIHLGISPKGFYASVSSPKHNYYIDKYSKTSNEIYISYYTKDYHEPVKNMACGTASIALESKNEGIVRRRSGENLPLRAYRLALACTGEFGAFFGPAKSDVLAEFVKSVNRINLITENDLALRLVLIDETEKLIFTDPDTDSYTGNSGGALLGENTGVIQSNIAFGDYDVGHVYTRGCNDVGGIASIRSLCSANKANGVTCHGSSDITSVAVRIAAHEFGHQFGSNHTFNNCNGNESGGTAFEPGSGSTIMSYGGLCGPALNIVNESSDYYHVSSLQEITLYTRSGLGDNCPEKIPTDNHIPEVVIPISGGFSIPISTPFELTGEATDEDGDQLTYNWEQYDLGPSSVPGSPQANSPLFISQYPSNTPTRVFPKMESIISNTSEMSEVLPTYSRDLTFQFIARDNNLESGGAAWTDIKFKADASAGPFLMDYPNGGEVFTVGQEIEILWDVANTDNEVIDCKNVDIYVSTDGGINFNHLLVESTANDGQEKIFIPNQIGENIRFKIKSSNNIFFDISNENFTISEPDEPGFVIEYDKSYFENCVPDQVTLNLTSTSFLGYDDPINLELVTQLEDGIDIQFEKTVISPGEGSEVTIEFSNPSISGMKIIELQATSNGDTIRRNIIFNLTSSDFSDIGPIAPKRGSSGVIVAPLLTWSPDFDASEYIFRLADNPSFDSEKTTILYDQVVTDTFFILDDILAKNTVYYWSVQGVNDCGVQADSEIYTFATEAISCNVYTYNDVPAPISQSGIIELEMPIAVNSLGQVSDVNIIKLRGPHSWVSELKGEIISPAGTKVMLFDNICLGTSDFNCGFDDDATTEITCPFNQGKFYIPEESLDTFNGEDISGDWVFKLTDKAIGNGGSVQEYKLELCSNVSLSSPYLVNNEEMPLPSGVGRRLSSEFLLVEDEDNSSDDLIYTIVDLPKNGLLRNNEDSIFIGSQFTQSDLNGMNIRYQHDGGATQDSFTFVVQDGDGGWIEKTTFQITIDDGVSLDVEEIGSIDFKVYPNPSTGTFSVDFFKSVDDPKFEVFNIAGQKMDLNINGKGDHFSIRIRGAIDGIYLIRIRTSDFNRVERVVVNR